MPPLPSSSPFAFFARFVVPQKSRNLAFPPSPISSCPPFCVFCALCGYKNLFPRLRSSCVPRAFCVKNAPPWHFAPETFYQPASAGVYSQSSSGLRSRGAAAPLLFPFCVFCALCGYKNLFPRLRSSRAPRASCVRKTAPPGTLHMKPATAAAPPPPALKNRQKALFWTNLGFLTVFRAATAAL